MLRVLAFTYSSAVLLFEFFPGTLRTCAFRSFRSDLDQFGSDDGYAGVAKVRKETSFHERKVPFAKGRFWLRKEDFSYFSMPVWK